jgi:hypothetical protein
MMPPMPAAPYQAAASPPPPRQPVYPAGYYGGPPAAGPYPAAAPQAGVPQAAAPQAQPAVPTVQELMVTLRDSLYPSQREWAADQLSAPMWQNDAQVVQALTTAAKEDPAPLVRAGCVHALARMRINTVPVVAVVQALKNDPDPRVRTEAEQALSDLGVTSPAGQGIQPVAGPGGSH